MTCDRKCSRLKCLWYNQHYRNQITHAQLGMEYNLLPHAGGLKDQEYPDVVTLILATTARNKWVDEERKRMTAEMKNVRSWRM